MTRAAASVLAGLAALCFWVESGEAQRQIGRHQGVARWAEFSHDGKRIASVGENSLIRIWDAETSELLRIIDGKSWIYGLYFSPNGRYLAAYPGKAYWHVETGKPERLPQDEYLCSYPAFTPDSKAFIASGREGVLRLRDAETGRILTEMKSSFGIVFRANLSPDGRLAACEEEGQVEVWNLKTGKLTALIETPEDLSDLVFLPDSRTIAAVSFRADNVVAVHLLDALTGEVKRSYDAGLYRAYLSPDSATLATYGEKETSAWRKILLWDVKTGAVKSELEGVYSFLGFSPDGKLAAGRTDVDSFGVWDVETGALKVEREIHVYKMRFSPDSTRIVGLAGLDIAIYDAETLQTHQGLEGHGSEVVSVQFSQDGRSVLSVGGDWSYIARIWNASTGELRMWTPASTGAAALSPDGRTVASNDGVSFEAVKVPTGETIAEIAKALMGQVAYSPDGKTLAYVVGNATKKVYFWDAAKSARLKKTYEHDSSIQAIAYSPDGAAFAAAGEESIRLWDTETDELKQSINIVGIAEADEIAFSPDGKTLVSSGKDLVVRIWSAERGYLRTNLRGHKKYVYSVAYSPDGETIASAGNDGLILLWNAKTFQLERTLSGHVGRVNSVAFSPDSSSLISGGKDGRVLLWLLENLPVLWSDFRQPNSRLLQTTLLPNYPNPFNPETWIPFDLAQESAAAITIYDSAGQAVRRMELGELAAGSYRAKEKAAYWDGKDALGAPAASGVYFVRIEAGSFSETRRMVLLK